MSMGGLSHVEINDSFADRRSLASLSASQIAKSLNPNPEGAMPRRGRKFLGVLLTIGFVIVYALIAMALAQGRFIHDAPGFVQGLYYAVIGMAWILPIMPLIRWMERPD